LQVGGWNWRTSSSVKLVWNIDLKQIQQSYEKQVTLRKVT
jgi:hypothetical protein